MAGCSDPEPVCDGACPSRDADAGNANDAMREDVDAAPFDADSAGDADAVADVPDADSDANDPACPLDDFMLASGEGCNAANVRARDGQYGGLRDSATMTVLEAPDYIASDCFRLTPENPFDVDHVDVYAKPVELACAASLVDDDARLAQLLLRYVYTYSGMRMSTTQIVPTTGDDPVSIEFEAGVIVDEIYVCRAYGPGPDIAVDAILVQRPCP